MRSRRRCSPARWFPPIPPSSLPPSSQIGHAGEGGLYAELVQDRSFDALAAATGFAASPAARRLDLDLPALARQFRGASEPLYAPPQVRQ